MDATKFDNFSVNKIQDKTQSTSAGRPSPWDDAPLRSKMVAMTAMSMIAGCAAGIVATTHPQGVYVLLVGMTTCLAVMLWFGKRYVWGPYDELVATIRRIARADGPAAIDTLPLTRGDELGDIARGLHQLTSWAIRDHRDAHLIRKTVDRRVEKATRQATQQLRGMAMRDALTDLGNRHFLDDNLESLAASVRETSEDLICIIVDLDNFKQVNDSLGHQTGDELLILVGSLIRACIRGTDIAVRLGGDEFVILLPGCDMKRAGMLAHRISSLFLQHTRTTVRTDQPVSLSMGIASMLQDHLRTGHELLEAADRKLYEAKRAGKSRAVGA